MSIWVVFIILYGILKGLREPIKKSILMGINVPTALFVYSFIGFIMSAFSVEGAFDIPLYMYGLLVVKTFSVFIAWIASFLAIKKVPVSIYGITDMARVIFSTLLSILFLHESLTVKSVASLILIVIGLYFANKKTGINDEEYSLKYIAVIILSCFLNAVSGIMDKYIMSTGDITASALQFWFMLIISVFYLLYIVIRREKFEIKKAIKNPWIYVLSLSLIVGDRLLFVANSDPNSKVTLMTLIKQSSAIVTILSGKFIYKEKNILKKLFCALLILVGISLVVF